MHAITPVTGTQQVQKGAVEQKGSAAAAPSPEEAARPGLAVPIVNPSLRFDLRLGLVVVEFFDERGEVATSIPTPRQLKAYESGLGMRPGPEPLPRDLPARASQDGLAVLA